MDKQIITFRADKGQNLTKESGNSEYASDTIAYIKAKFELGEQWNDFEKISAVWCAEGKVIASQLTEGICNVPNELQTKRGAVEVNLCGTNYENGLVKERLTTFPIVAFKITRKATI